MLYQKEMSGEVEYFENGKQCQKELEKTYGKHYRGRPKRKYKSNLLSWSKRTDY